MSQDSCTVVAPQTYAAHVNIGLQAQQASGLVLTRFATRAAIAVYDKEHNLSAVLRLFEKAVASMEADTDIYTDTMASCFASSKFEVQPALGDF